MRSEKFLSLWSETWISKFFFFVKRARWQIFYVLWAVRSLLQLLIICWHESSHRQHSNGLGGRGASGKEPACQCRRCRRHGFDPWVRKIPWRRKQQPTPVFLPGKSHGQRSLVGYSSWGHKEWPDLATEYNNLTEISEYWDLNFIQFSWATRHFFPLTDWLMCYLFILKM